MPNNNDIFKLLTRRWLAWPIAWLYALTVCFLAVWGAITRQMELVTLAGAMIASGIAFILGYYFAKKTSEE